MPHFIGPHLYITCLSCLHAYDDVSIAIEGFIIIYTIINSRHTLYLTAEQ